jgi:uncharacterized protein
VKSGEVVRVKVLEVDEARKRISLTLRLDDEPARAASRSGAESRRGREARRPGRPGVGAARAGAGG